MKVQEISSSESANIFTGNIYIFYAFDIGDDIDIEAIEKMRSVIKAPQRIPKYFKNYHVPLAISLPIDHISPRCISSKIHNFGVISLIYKIPFTTTLKELHATFGNIAESFIAQSDDDARVIYKKIEGTVTHPNFSNMSTWYAIIQTNPQPHIKEPKEIQKSHADTIASLLRFETETLSEHQINDIWNSAIGYFHGDLIIIDTDAAFIYDDEYEELLDLFEFANIQRLELCYFDRMLDTNLKAIYEGKVKQFPTHAYLPLISLFLDDPIERLGKTKVDISVITERLESTIKLAGEPYLSEVHDLLVDNLDLKSWQNSIDRKLKIVESVQQNYQHKIETSREDLLSVLILILIFIEVMVALWHK